MSGPVFLLIPFQILKKAYLQVRKFPSQFFLLIPFSNIKKIHTYKSESFPASFFCSSLFQILEKSILTNLKILLFILIIILKETLHIKTIIQTIFIKTIIQTIFIKTIAYKQFCNH